MDGHRLYKRAQRARLKGNYFKAITSYQKVLKHVKNREENRRHMICYWVAYCYWCLWQQQHDDLSALGVDLTKRYEDCHQLMLHWLERAGCNF